MHKETDVNGKLNKNIHLARSQFLQGQDKSQTLFMKSAFFACISGHNHIQNHCEGHKGIVHIRYQYVSTFLVTFNIQFPG